MSIYEADLDKHITPADKQALINKRIKDLATAGMEAVLDQAEAEQRGDGKAIAEALTKQEQVLEAIQALGPKKQAADQAAKPKP